MPRYTDIAFSTHDLFHHNSICMEELYLVWNKDAPAYGTFSHSVKINVFYQVQSAKYWDIAKSCHFCHGHSYQQLCQFMGLNISNQQIWAISELLLKWISATNLQRQLIFCILFYHLTNQIYYFILFYHLTYQIYFIILYFIISSHLFIT